MILPKRIFPETFNKKEFSSTPFAESLPFHIKECGYIRERKRTCGIAGSNDNRVRLYQLCVLIFGIGSYTI